MSHSNRILVVSQHFWPESFRVNDICDFFIEKGCEVEVLCGLPNYPGGQFPEGYGYFKNHNQTHNGVTVHRALEIRRDNNSNLRIFINYVSFPLFSLLHVPRLLTKKYDKIFLFQTSPVLMSITGIVVGRLKRTETTMYVLDLWPENLYSVLNIKNSLLRKLAASVSAWHYRHVDKLIVLSEKMKERVIEITHISPEKITVLPQACEKIYEQEIHDEQLKKRFSRGFNLVFTGSITPAQSFETIITAAQKLKSEGLHDINWIIVGDGMSRAEVETRVNDAGLADTFFFEGQKPITDIPRYTAIADGLIGCLVKSDLLEATIPAKVMSYIASGKPVALAMDGEVQSLINTTISGGFVGPAGNATVLTKNITRLYKLSKAERRAMGQRMRNYHFKYFERNIVLNKLFDFMFG